MSHGASPDPIGLADPVLAQRVAEQMQALATPSRLRLLACLHQAPRSVGELSDAVEMEASAVSHQLRILRGLGFVAGQRDGKRVVYRLHDEHISQLLAEAMSHAEHLQLSAASRTGIAAIAAT